MSGNSSCSSTCSHKSNNGLLIVIVLYILLAIILEMLSYIKIFILEKLSSDSFFVCNTHIYK